MSSPERLTFRIDGVEIDLARGCVLRDAQEQYLRRQAFDVLVFLIKHPQELVTKEQLREAVWNGAAVTDDALVQCIVDIRRALGDDSRQPRFVKTVPKLGYRFVGALDRPEPNESPDPRATQGASEIVPRSGRWLMVTVIAGALVVGVLGWVAYQGPFRRPIPESGIDAALPIVPGRTRVAVAYFENLSGRTDLAWLRQGLSEMLITELSRTDALSVLTHQQLAVVMDRTGLKEDAAVKLDEALEIARRSRAEIVVVGDFAAIGEAVRIDVRLLDGRSGAVMGSATATADTPAQVLTQVGLLGVNVVSQVAGPQAYRATGVGLDVTTNDLEAYRYYALALEQGIGLRSSEAIALLEKAINRDPNFAMAHARIGYMYALTYGLTDRAKPYLEKAFQLSDRLTDKERLSIAAWYASANRDYPAAVAAFRQLIARFPDDVEANWRLGGLLEGEEEFDEAIAVLKRALVIDPDAGPIYNTLGAVYSEMSRHDEAIAARQRFVALSPREPNAYDSLGLAYYWAGQYDKASEMYKQALALDPKFAVAVVHLGNLYFQRGRYRDALEQYRRYVDVATFDPDRSRGFDCMAWVYLKLGEREHARAAARRAATLDKYAAFTAPLVALELGDRESARRLAANMFSVPYSNRGVRPSRRTESYLRGRLALADGRSVEAINYLKEALRHRPLSWSIESYEDGLADAFLSLGQWDAAIEEYKRMLGINPNWAMAHFHLAQAYERKGDVGRAMIEYRRFVDIWHDADRDLPVLVDARKRLAASPEGH